MEGVVRAFTQIQAKGVVFAEEINQIAERLPQIRTAMMEAFGSARTEELQAQGVTAREFLQGIVTELGKLPKAGNDTANMLENLNNSVEMLQKEIGTLLLPLVRQIVTALTDWVESIRDLDDSVLKSYINIAKWVGALAIGVSTAIAVAVAMRTVLTVGAMLIPVFAGLASGAITLNVAISGLTYGIPLLI